MNYISYLLLFFLFFSGKVFSQSDCDKKIIEAENSLASAEYNNCIQILTSALSDCNNSKKEKEDIYELLIKAFIETDNVVEQDAYAKKLLENNPTYELKETNNTEDYNRLIKKFDVHPLLSIGIRNTAMDPSFETKKIYSVLLDKVDYSAPYSTSNILLMYYAWAELQFNKNTSLNLELTLLNIQLERNFSKLNWEMTYHEKMSFIETPIYLKKYIFSTKTVFPFISLGLSYLRLTRSRSDATINYLTESPITGDKSNFYSATNNMDMLPMRNKNTVSALAGLGIGFKFKNFGIYLDGRYYRGLNNLTKTQKRFYNESLINNYFYIDNAVLLTKFEAGITIAYTLKNSIKKNR